jgi:hypothetical protein
VQPRTHEPQRPAQGGETAAGIHDPRHHVRKMSAEFAALIDHLRRDIGEVDEPEFKAMFETAAEVLGGLATAFRRYEQKSEPACSEAAQRARNS